MEIRLVGFPLFSPHDIRFKFTIDFKVCKVQRLYDAEMRQLHRKHVIYFLATFAYFPQERITHTTSSTTSIACKLIFSTTQPNFITGHKFENASSSPLQRLNKVWPILNDQLLTRWAMHNLPSNTLDGHACKYFSWAINKYANHLVLSEMIKLKRGGKNCNTHSMLWCLSLEDLNVVSMWLNFFYL